MSNSGSFAACDTGAYTRETWLTPPNILSALGEFDLDPCAAPSPRPWPTARRHIELPINGLQSDWEGNRVWCNPPYGNQVRQWLEKLANHGNGIALIFARTETAVFQDHVFGRAHAILFLRSRITFCDQQGKPCATGNAPAPSCLVAYGANNANALATCGLAGKLVAFNPSGKTFHDLFDRSAAAEVTHALP